MKDKKMKCLRMKIDPIQPSQLYLNREKLQIIEQKINQTGSEAIEAVQLNWITCQNGAGLKTRTRHISTASKTERSSIS